MVAIRKVTQAKPTPLPPRRPLPFPGPAPLPPAAESQVADIEHVAALFERYADRVRAYARGKLWAYNVHGDLRDLADEICSQVFLAWLVMMQDPRRRHFLPAADDGTHNELRYLLGMARMRCRDLVVGERHRSWQRLGPDYPELDPPAPPLVLCVDATAAAQDADSETQRRGQQACAALAKVRPQYAALLTSVYQDGATCVSLAAQRGVSALHVQGELQKARIAFMGAYGTPDKGLSYQTRTRPQATVSAAMLAMLRRAAAPAQRLPLSFYQVSVRYALYLLAVAPDTCIIDRAWLLASLRQTAKWTPGRTWRR